MSKDWLCRIGWHKFAIRRNLESGGEAGVYLECRRCGKQKEVPRVEPGAGLGM